MCKLLRAVCRRQREVGTVADKAQGTHVQDAASDAAQDAMQQLEEDSAQQPKDSEEEMREEIQARLPGAEWKARIGAAGTPMEQQRVSPIVELSMLLVMTSIIMRSCMHPVQQ